MAAQSLPLQIILQDKLHLLITLMQQAQLQHILMQTFMLLQAVVKAAQQALTLTFQMHTPSQNLTLMIMLTEHLQE